MPNEEDMKKSEDKSSEGENEKENEKGEEKEGGEQDESGKKGDTDPQIKKLRKENAKKRVENKELRDKLAAIEANKAEGDNEDAKKESDSKPRDRKLLEIMNKRLIRSELKAAALKAGIRDLDAMRMFDTSSLEVNDDGDVIGINELIEDMIEAKDYLFNQQAKDTTSDKRTPGGTSPRSKNALDMSDDEFKAGAKELGINADYLV